jgi:hypothetical protein
MKVIGIGSKMNMLRLQNGEDVSWYKILDSNVTVKEAINSLKVGDEVDVQYTKANDVKVINTLGLMTAALTIEAPKAAVVTEAPKISANNFTQPAKLQEFKCESCGVSMKDGTYKTCYPCSMAARASGKFDKSPAVQDAIKRQAIGHMTSRSLIALQKDSPLITSNSTLEDTIRKLYKLYQELVG